MFFYFITIAVLREELVTFDENWSIFYLSYPASTKLFGLIFVMVSISYPTISNAGLPLSIEVAAKS